MTESEIIRVLETALLCAQQPMNSAELRKMFVSPPLSADDLRRYLAILQLDWKERGLELVQVASGWRFQSRPAMQVFLSRLSLERAPKYSRAVLETLAIIAWRQPVTRGDIEDIRGVSVSTQIVRTLEDRGWIEVLGYRDAPGRPALLGTTRQFLNDLGLRSLDELPAVEALDSLDVLSSLPSEQAAASAEQGNASDQGLGHQQGEDHQDQSREQAAQQAAEQAFASVATQQAGSEAGQEIEQEAEQDAALEVGMEPLQASVAQLELGSEADSKSGSQDNLLGAVSEAELPQTEQAEVNTTPDPVDEAQAAAGLSDVQVPDEIKNSGVND
ncbi:SMC-Scp complex subunit ScpB [Alcaligenes aquatilis]|uniref:SMC-Scp complex subunit ScpB n=2 Tax=Alcaligenes TaxID=507 RepID=A0AB33CSU2_ALCFA|nr:MULTISPECIES: SMC-Scp complex subunit ScpB [Alcaligenes]ASR88874.1 SMC-Scp complex subunit ScpB [Alcaligenes faecalis]AWG35389.1 SMC-Scp complex subunit ScpB [Alcaligenes aquatilis]QXR36983.1 SMC-Scp complex subunit ScpB [Alcaligenes aquatilis]UYY88311.1 SMC-Scp complex subunit ScpB [Alcaligenes sp. SMD-FA]HBQ89556.1 SMC-Scp complex subunit ScpB [Alcaligenes faecalis]